MSDNSLEPDFNARVKSAWLLQIVKYVNVANVTLLIVDYIQTLDLEIALIWNAKWSIVKMLFLIARYPTFLDISLVLYVTLSHHQSDKNCAVAYDISSVITLIGIGAAEVIFVLRTYALWGNNKNLLRFLVSQVIVIYIPEIVCLALFLRSLEYGSPPLPSVAGCYQTAGSDIIFINFVLLLYHEAVLMVLTVWVGIKRYRHSSNPLITTLYRDGILYFVWLFIISAANIFVLAAGPRELLDLLTNFQRIMHSILSTRVILHVRHIARYQEQESTIGMSRSTRSTRDYEGCR